MPISTLRISDFRNVTALDIAPDAAGLNIICGDNGSGKTSLLEAIHYLGSGKSFRSSVASRLVRHETEKFSLFAQLVNEVQHHIAVGVERDIKGNTRLRMDEKELQSFTDFAYLLPVRLINSQSHHLFESGPIYRRKYLDWGLFYQSEGFLHCWRQLERILKQRNAGLRDKRAKNELSGWTDELVKYGLELNALRQDYVQTLAPLIENIASELLGFSFAQLTMTYLPGWPKNQDYPTVLANSYMDDLRLGYTQYGPHRADVEISVNDVSVKHFLSRGQQKLLICAMIIAQGMLLAKQTNKRLIYLVDDLPSELDAQSRQRLISLLLTQQSQVFITAIESASICEFIDNKSSVPVKLFHVEHGQLLRTTRHC